MTSTTRDLLPSKLPRHGFREAWTGFCTHALQLVAALLFSSALASAARASDHLDSPATVANSQADIADVYAWDIA